MALTAAEKSAYKALAKSYNQRGRRLVAGGFERGPKLPGLKNIQSADELRAETEKIRAWMADPAHTIKGARAAKITGTKGAKIDASIEYMMQEAQRQAQRQAATVATPAPAPAKPKRKTLTPEQKRKHAEAQRRYRARKKREKQEATVAEYGAGYLQLWKNALKANGKAIPPDKIEEFTEYLSARQAQINDKNYYSLQAAAEEFTALLENDELDVDQMAEAITADFEKWLIEKFMSEELASADLQALDRAGEKYSAAAMHDYIMKAARRK